jgi:hypothetical protein
VLGF